LKGESVSQISDTRGVEEDRQQSFASRLKAWVAVFAAAVAVAALMGLMFWPEAVQAINHSHI
jgi:hypothetical protein